MPRTVNTAGTSAAMKEKSSAPMEGAAISSYRASLPATPATSVTKLASLTVAGYGRASQLQLAEHPWAAAVPDATCSNRARRRSTPSAVTARKVPANLTESPTTFGAPSPVLKRATVSTAGSVGAVSRLIRACSPTTVSAAAITASAVSCGMDAWPPRPLTVQSNVSRAARMVPARDLIVPAGAVGQTWRALAADTPSRAPSLTMSCAPPGPSSAG
mmetsp:Transcript_11908/g.35638  ORF Transcript_11908/g.35638 Transcript_11908/m.35638 type:complete len:216 (+) Transcript_11908:585-1232(+)